MIEDPRVEGATLGNYKPVMAMHIVNNDVDSGRHAILKGPRGRAAAGERYLTPSIGAWPAAHVAADIEHHRVLHRHLSACKAALAGCDESQLDFKRLMDQCSCRAWAAATSTIEHQLWHPAAVLVK